MYFSKQFEIFVFMMFKKQKMLLSKINFCNFQKLIPSLKAQIDEVESSTKGIESNCKGEMAYMKKIPFDCSLAACTLNHGDRSILSDDSPFFCINLSIVVSHELLDGSLIRQENYTSCGRDGHHKSFDTHNSDKLKKFFLVF